MNNLQLATFIGVQTVLFSLNFVAVLWQGRLKRLFCARFDSLIAQLDAVTARPKHLEQR